MSLMSKGENDFEDLGVAIKFKGGDCWHYGTGVVLHGSSLWCQILVQHFRMKENTYTQVHLDEDTYTCELYVTNAHMHIHALSRKEKRVHVGKLTFGPWYLVLGN